MAALCDSCHWTGTSAQVRDGGRCPECGERIRYERAPLIERRIELTEFNQRAVAALGGVDFGSFNSTERVVAEFQRQHAAGTVSPKMQQAIFNIAHRYRKQITDMIVLKFAEFHARGAD